MDWQIHDIHSDAIFLFTKVKLFPQGRNGGLHTFTGRDGTLCWASTQLKQQEFEALLADGYREMSKENATIVAESLPLQTAATEGVWKWDE